MPTPRLPALAGLLRVAATSGIPGGGFLLGEWSPATALTLYWIENGVSSVAMGIRIALHRRWTNLAGHDRAQLDATFKVTSGRSERTVEFKSFLAEFVLTSVSFTVAHGIFIGAVLGFIIDQRPEKEALREGAIGIAICHALSLLVDGMSLREWPFARLKHQASNVMGRLAVIHMSLPGGMVLMTWYGAATAFFSAFVWLKFLADVTAIVPQWNPQEPPRLLVRLMSLFPKQKGETFEEYWRRTRASETALAEENERVREAPRGTRRKR